MSGCSSSTGIKLDSEYDEYGNVLESLKSGAFKNSPNLKDFQDSRKIFHHIDRVYDLWKTGDTVPVHMTVGLTNYCQHKCPWCYINYDQAGANSKRSGAGDPDKKAINADDKLINAVLEAREMGLKAITFVGDGEPTLHKRFADYSYKLRASGLQLGLYSNMSFKREEVFQAFFDNFFFVRCSLDSANAEYHNATHGNDDFDLVISNLKRTVALKKERKTEFPIIGVQYVTSRGNYKDLPVAAKMYKEMGVDYMTIKPMYKNILNTLHKDNDLTFEEVKPYMQEAESFADGNFKVYAKYSQFIETLGRKTNDGVYYKKCYATPISPYLDENGNVEMCGNLKGRGYTMGNIYKNSFKEIWYSEQRKDCLNRIDLNTCPAGCKLDPLNKVLWDAFHPEEKKTHPNFT